MEQAESERTGDPATPKRKPRLAIRQAWLHGKMPREQRGPILIDRRTKIGKEVCDFRVQLTAHVGDQPSVTQRHLIEVCCQLKMRLMSMDLDFADRGDITLLDSRVYLAWTNSLIRALRALGLARPARAGPSIDDIVGAIRRQKPSDTEDLDDLAGLDADE